MLQCSNSPSTRPTPKPRWRNCRTIPAVFALYGAEAHAEPYIGRTPNLRGATGTAAPAFGPTSAPIAVGRARAAHRLASTGSEFESLLKQFSLLEEIYGAKALERMHLRAPAFVRFLGGNPYPRITVTHRPSQREADWSYGPFPSRAAAERYAEEMLKLFLLRRCTFESGPRPELSRLRLLRDEDVPRALLQGLHGRALRRGGRSGRELSGHARREPAGHAAHPAGSRPRPILNSSPPRRFTLKSSEWRACAPSPPSWFARLASFARSFCRPRPIRTRLPFSSMKTAVSAVRRNSPRWA